MIKGVGVDIYNSSNQRTLISGLIDTEVTICVIDRKGYNKILRILSTDFGVEDLPYGDMCYGWLIFQNGEFKLIKRKPDLISYSVDDWVKEYLYLKAKYRHTSLMDNRKPIRRRNGGFTYLYQAHDVVTGEVTQWLTATALADQLRCSHYMVYKAYSNGHHIEGRYTVDRRPMNEKGSI